jgi:hypothetical protein
MDMLEVVTDAFFGQLGIAVSDDDISSRARQEFAGNMTKQHELPFAPCKINLFKC